MKKLFIGPSVLAMMAFSGAALAQGGYSFSGYGGMPSYNNSNWSAFSVITQDASNVRRGSSVSQFGLALQNTAANITPTTTTRWGKGSNNNSNWAAASFIGQSASGVSGHANVNQNAIAVQNTSAYVGGLDSLGGIGTGLR